MTRLMGLRRLLDRSMAGAVLLCAVGSLAAPPIAAGQSDDKNKSAKHLDSGLTLSESVSFDRLSSKPELRSAPELGLPARPVPHSSEGSQNPGSKPAAGTNRAGANPATLTLQPGDVINLTVFGRPELSSAIYVSDSGHIDVPLAGTIPITGLSLAEASERVATAYREGQYLIDPQVNIALGAIRSQQFSIVGEVKNPGRFPLETRTSILDALALAGGISETGARKAFVLRRKAENELESVRFEVDLSDLLKAGSGRVEEIRAGDTIVVPKAPLFYIYGEVARPDAYPLRDQLTVIEAISVAGGLTPRGSTNRIRVKRKNDDGRIRQISIKIDDLVQPQDVINVRERIF